MKILYKQISDYMSQQHGTMVTLLEQLVNIESGPEQPEGIDAIIEVFKREFDQLGLESRIIEMERAGNTIVSVYKPEGVESDKPIVLSGHMDTVFQPGVLSEHSFKYMDDRFARGAGISDMKGGLVIALYTLKALIHLGYKKHPVKMLFIGDEETLHRHSNTRQVMLEELKGAAMMLNFEPATEAQHLGVSRKGGAMVTLEVDGIGAHSGGGATIGRSAIVELAYKIIELESKTDIQRGKLINCGLIEGGVSTNTIPAYAKANIAIRFSNQATKDEILRDLENIVTTSHIQDTTSRYTVESFLDAMEFTLEVSQLADHFIKVGSECGYGPLVKNKSEGVSDASLGVVAGVPTLCSMGIIGSGAHTMEEEADLDSLVGKAVLAVSGIIAY
ncbi:M20/M25/M40 family metallo-hydrolase [Aerococcaceae bacterium DSM 111021]|nr:M20/M25/M40 family metallo-hydrolase [Aerococcaceae bacterium DSM 111021]